MKLTESTLERITRSKQHQTGKLVSDDQQRGLYLRIGKTGTASWCLVDQRGGKFSTRTFGEWPRMPVEKARAEAARLRLEDRGVGTTWEAAATRYLKERAKLVQPTALRNIERVLLTHLADLKSTRLDDLKREHAARIILAFHAEKPETGKKLLSQAKALTRWCAVTGLIDRDPLDLLDKTIFGNYRSRPRTRLATDDEIRAIFVDDSPTGRVLRWQLYTACRVSEALQFEASQVDEHGVWTIPEDATKSQREHRVPLSKAALKLALQEMPPAISYSGVAQHMAKHYGDLRSHDARRTAATRARQLGASAELAHYLLNHARPVLDATYLHHDMVSEARDALEALAVHYENVTKNRKSAPPKRQSKS